MDNTGKAISFLIYYAINHEEKDLIEAIDCFYNQVMIPESIKNEIIILLDGIDSNRLNNLKVKLLNYDNNKIKLIESKINVGRSSMVLKGIEEAKGEFIAFSSIYIPWYRDSAINLYKLAKVNSVNICFGPIRNINDTANKKSLEYGIVKKSFILSILKKVINIEMLDIAEQIIMNEAIKSESYVVLKGKTLVVTKYEDKKQSDMSLRYKEYLLNQKLDTIKLFEIKEYKVSNNASISILIYHNRNMTEDNLIKSINSFKEQTFINDGNPVEIIILLDGVKEYQLPILKNLYLKNKSEIILLESIEEFKGPGELWNKGIKISSGKWVAFIWSGVQWYKDSLYYLLMQAQKNNIGAFGKIKYESNNYKSSFTPMVLGNGEMSERTVKYQNSIPLCYSILNKEIVKEEKGFLEDKEYSRLIDWEFLRRITNKYKLAFLNGKTLVVKKHMEDFNYNFKAALDEDIRRFYLKCEIPKYKVAIISGVSEDVQIQLCILNYFEEYGEKNEFSVRRFLENEVIEEELTNYDLVFFVRSRTLNAANMARYCLENKIKTIYILDDNWFCATETYPQLESQIGKESLPYQYFILLLALVDKVFVYNNLVKEDIKRYSNSITKMPISINLKDFNLEGKKDNSYIHIGFAGSSSKTQHFTEAFKALKRIMEEFKNVKLYFKGVKLPSEFEKFKTRIIKEDYSYSYKDYAKTVSSWCYDIMISPLDDTRYINSKCINKYLEITAMGAVGIYTNIPLYRQVIINKQNGLLVNNSETEWYMNIKNLILTPDLCRTIYSNARRDIIKNYSTETVLPEFFKQINSLLKGGS